jgi:hypothetical protein
MEQKMAVDVALEKLKEAQVEIYKLDSPPYPYPSINGRVAQLVSDTINMLGIIKQKSEMEKI